MIKRRVHEQLVAAIENNPAVGLLGSRQSGKTTLALEIGRTRPSLYLYLEAYSDFLPCPAAPSGRWKSSAVPRPAWNADFISRARI
jgi:hypothetical protein